MKRLNLIGSWKRLGVQASLLTGLGLAFFGNTERPAMALDPVNCPSEGECTFLKPNILVILDYSSSLNEKFGDDVKTRWVAVKEAIDDLLQTDNEFFDKNANFALMRFGHDPSANPGSTIACDISDPKITDGQAIDAWWYDLQGDDKAFYSCAGDAVQATLAAMPPPCGGMVTGIGTWTKGALDRAKSLIAQSKADHPSDMDGRYYGILAMSDGKWTSQPGTMTLTPASEDPALTAGTLFNDDKVPTYFVYFGDQGDVAAKNASDKIAMAGGTGQAILAANPVELVTALTDVLTDIKNSVQVPQCAPGLPRFMVLLDASSSMLNVMGVFGKEGETGWDQARDALAGANSIFDIAVNNGKNDAEDLIHLGLAVFGHNTPAPGEQKILVDYGPCRRDNFNWALDPNSSCTAPGCTNPWGGPAITWTFKDGSVEDPPGFDDQTLSHMPKCAGAGFCSGSGTYTHLGLQRIKTNLNTYHLDASTNPNAQFPTNADTVYANILVTDGQYDLYSTDAQVQAELQAIYNSPGLNKKVITYVIGFGDGVDSPAAILQLKKMACWGSGGTFAGNLCDGGQYDYFDANTQEQLEAAFKQILENQGFDPCCKFNDCSAATPDNKCNPDEPDTCPENYICVIVDEVYDCVLDPDTCNGKQIDPGEQCDGAELGGATCQSLGYDGGTLACNNTCQFDLSGCTEPPVTKCDGMALEPGEQCDGADLGGASCMSQGFDGGTLLCTDTCMFDTSKCTNDPGETSETETIGETYTSSDATTGGGSGDTGSATETDSDTGTDSATDTGPPPEENGCSCAVEESAKGKARGLLGALFGLGLVGFMRRRRRAA
jgi:MYXO-CTERM domain-containing protein